MVASSCYAAGDILALKACVLKCSLRQGPHCGISRRLGTEYRSGPHPHTQDVLGLETQHGPEPHRPLTILTMGDSNTWGTGNPDLSGEPAVTVGYRQPLKRALEEIGSASRFVGSFRVGYATLDDCATEAWPGKGINTLIWRVREGILECYEPDVCLLLIGANNMWRSLNDRRPIGPLRTLYWIWRLQRLLGEMRRRRPTMAIAVGLPVTPSNTALPLALYRGGVRACVAGVPPRRCAHACGRSARGQRRRALYRLGSRAGRWPLVDRAPTAWAPLDRQPPRAVCACCRARLTGPLWLCYSGIV